MVATMIGDKMSWSRCFVTSVVQEHCLADESAAPVAQWASLWCSAWATVVGAAAMTLRFTCNGDGSSTDVGRWQHGWEIFGDISSSWYTFMKLCTLLGAIGRSSTPKIAGYLPTSFKPSILRGCWSVFFAALMVNDLAVRIYRGLLIVDNFAAVAVSLIALRCD